VAMAANAMNEPIIFFMCCSFALAQRGVMPVRLFQ
jgi:hypothetical protein